MTYLTTVDYDDHTYTVEDDYNYAELYELCEVGECEICEVVGVEMKDIELWGGVTSVLISDNEE
jgi:hypothetical protein